MPWLYDVQVPVRSQIAAERQRAGRIALQELLTRLTGLAQVPHHAEIDAALGAPERFFVSYRFSRRDAMSAAGQGAQEFLDVSFQPGDVLALLRRAGMPVWSANRPSVLVWLAIERGPTREIVAAGADLAAALDDRARRRGLQLRMPLMDLADFAIEPADVWGRFSPRLAQASVRYGPELVLLGRAAQTADGRWSSDWDIRRADGKPLPVDGRFVKRHQSAAGVAEQAVDQMADLLAARFAVRGDLVAIPVRVSGAGSIRDYAALLDHLQSQAYIERVHVDAVRAQTMELRLFVRSGRDQLAELLALGDRFVVEAAPSSSFDAALLDLAWRSDG